MSRLASLSTAASSARWASRFVLVAGVLAGCLLLSGCGSEVPDVRGQSLTRATETLADAGFSVGRVTYDESRTAMTGVIWQDPAAKERGDAGSVVELMIAGPRPVAMPELVGVGRDRAAALLAATGLGIGSDTETYSPSVPEGVVVTQTPAPGVETTRGAMVGIVVSAGPAPVAVPSVLGLAESAAKQRLAAVGFAVGVKRAYSTRKKGTVAAQSPSGGAAAVGSTVLLTVSMGPKPRPKPKPEPAAAPVLKKLRGVLAIWAPNSRGVSDPRTGYAYVDVGGMRVRASCSNHSIGEGAAVWVAKQPGGGWIVTGRR